MRLWLDSNQAPPNFEDFVWFRSGDMASFSITLNEKKGCPYDGIDVGHVVEDFMGCDGIGFLRWLEKTGRNYPVITHSMDPVERKVIEEIVGRNGWDRLMNYTVGFAVDGRAYVEARGKSPAEAAQKAIVDFSNVDLGELECVDFKPVIAYDENDEIIDDYDIANGDWYKPGEEQSFTIGFKVDCRVYVDVIVRSPAEAVRKAESDFCMVALGTLEVNSWKPVHVEDEKGLLYDSERDLFGNGVDMVEGFSKEVFLPKSVVERLNEAKVRSGLSDVVKSMQNVEFEKE